ncbi:MAG TPA: WHG domain-containing protein, partial [Mycobacteriales bacterium]|nr:WHG domain-containing protein [Mycobacteriales bacterium]
MRTRRETTRAATIQEIKDTALARMRAQGTVDVRLSDVARDMRMSAPGLYRYFDGRDGLLTALIVDALTDMADRVEKARDALPATDPGGRFLAAARAYREWALADREGFTLVFGPALADFDKGHQAHLADGAEPGPDKAAALRAMEALRSLTRDADAQGTRRPLPLATLPPSLKAAMSESQLHGADPATELAMVHCWSSLHGFITLEVNGNLNWHGPDVREPMFLGLVRLLLALIGLPEPAGGWP